MKQMRKPRVLLLYKAMIPSVRLCGHCQLEYLAEQGKIEYHHSTAMQLEREELAWPDIVLLCRLDNAFEYNLARLLKQAGKYLIYVIDDDLLNVPADLASGKYYAGQEIQSSIRGMIDMSDAVLSPSTVLLEKYAADGRRGILMEEPAVDPVPYAPREAGKPIRIGFAGSTDRTGDLEQILKDVLLRIHQDYGEKVEFVFFGAVPSFARALNAQCAPYCDSYDAYRRSMNALKMDIGLAPMPDSPFHACKHYNKLIEYAAAGTVGIFSDVKPYDRLRTQFGWELLCPNTAETWDRAIRRLIDEPEYLDALKKQVAGLVEDVFSVPVIAGQLMDVLAEIPLSRRANAAMVIGGQWAWMKVVAVFHRVTEVVRRHGLKLPIVVLRKICGKLKQRLMAVALIRRVVGAVQHHGLKLPIVALKKIYGKLKHSNKD